MSESNRPPYNVMVFEGEHYSVVGVAWPLKKPKVGLRLVIRGGVSISNAGGASIIIMKAKARDGDEKSATEGDDDIPF